MLHLRFAAASVLLMVLCAGCKREQPEPPPPGTPPGQGLVQPAAPPTVTQV